MPSTQPTTKDPNYVTNLLARAHSPTTTARIVSEKITHKPLQLLPTKSQKTTFPSNAIADARTLRQNRRKAKSLSNSKSRNKPNPLSARQKRALCVHDMQKGEIKYGVYAGLHVMWCAYMRDILGIIAVRPQTIKAGSGLDGDNNGVGEVPYAYVTPASAGPKIASADFHGALVTVVRSRCVGRVGLLGLIVRDTKFTFVVVTKRDEVKTVPKEGTVFRIEVPLVDIEGNHDGGDKRLEADGVGAADRDLVKDLVFELQGEALMNRPPERASKKFKMHVPKDL